MRRLSPSAPRLVDCSPTKKTGPRLPRSLPSGVTCRSVVAMASQHDDDVYESPAAPSPDERSFRGEEVLADGEVANTWPIPLHDLERDVNVGYFVDGDRAGDAGGAGGVGSELLPVGYLESHAGYRWVLRCTNPGCRRADEYIYHGGNRGECLHCGGTVDYEFVPEIDSQTSPQAFSTPPKAVREATGTAGVQWSLVVVEIDGELPDEDGGLCGGAVTTRTAMDSSTCNKPSGNGTSRGTGSVPAPGGEPSPPGRAPVLPTEQTSSHLDLTGELTGMMEQDEKSNVRIRATKRKVRSPLSQEELDDPEMRRPAVIHYSRPGQRVEDGASCGHQPMYQN